MQKIVPFIWCNGTAEEAGQFYASIFRGGSTKVESRYPTEGLLEFQKPLAGQALTVNVSVGDYQFSLLNAGPDFSPNPSNSFLLNFDPLGFDGDPEAAREAIHALWEKMLDGGDVLMPLQEYPFSKLYGWIQDKYGMSWQLMLTDPAGDPRPFLIPSFLFVGEQYAHAREAIDLYTGLFEDSRIGAAVPQPNNPEALLFSDFQLAGQWFSAMDDDSEHAFSFSCGVSFQIQCEDQAEIDHFWNGLSAVSEAEQCGWLADKFGVSWQVVPANMGELMQKPGAFENMLEMKKIVIADF